MESSSEKVVLVTDQHPLSGIGVYTTRLYELLRESFPGLEVRNLHYFRFPHQPPHGSIPGQRYAASRLAALHALRSNERTLARQLNGSRALLHLCGSSYDLAAQVERSIATVHDFGLRTPSSFLSVQRRLLAVEAYSFVAWVRAPRFLKRCRKLVSISEYTRTRLSRLTGLDSVVIHHWIDDHRFRPHPKEASRSKLGLPLDRRILLSVTGGSANKNHAMLRGVVKALPADYLLVKVGFPINGPPGRIRNVGIVPDEAYPYYLNAADAYLHTSLREGFGIPLLEAMASGTPIVALANPPAPEILGEAANLVPTGARPGEFAVAVCSVVESPKHGERLSNLGLMRTRKFDPAVSLNLYRDVYLSAMRA